MKYDRINATLVVTPDELKELVRMVAAGDTDTAGADWVDAGIVADGRVDSVVAGIAHVAIDGDRTIVIERFDHGFSTPMWVAWDRVFRATITEPVARAATPTLAVTATRFELLPGLLRQAVKLHPGLPAARRPVVDTTAGVIDDLFVAVDDRSTPPAGDDSDLAVIVGSSRHSWRATGNWREQPADISIMVLDAGTEGLWTIERPSLDLAQSATATPRADRDTPVRLVPATAADITARLGDVVTGRLSPDPGR